MTALRDTHDPEASALRAASNLEIPDTETARLLTERLATLRETRPEYQRQLEARLLARLEEAARPWWWRSLTSAFRSPRRVPLRRPWPLVGAAAAAALVLTVAGSVALPFGQPPEASAAEILQRAEAFSKHPFATELQSFHLVADYEGHRRSDGSPFAATIEQWFALPDRMRSETRLQTADGSTSVAGSVLDGSTLTSYASTGATESEQFDVIMMAVPAVAVAPVGAGPGNGGAEHGKAEGGKAGAVFIRRTEDREGTEGQQATAGVRHEVRDEEKVEVRFSCGEPKRNGEATIAGRAAYVIEMDHSTCTVEGGGEMPPELSGRHILWADKETYLPLKMEQYDEDGALRSRYEVTNVEFGIVVADSVFDAVPPPGTQITRREELPEAMFETAPLESAPSQP